MVEAVFDSTSSGQASNESNPSDKIVVIGRRLKSGGSSRQQSGLSSVIVNIGGTNDPAPDWVKYFRDLITDKPITTSIRVLRKSRKK